MLNDQATAKFLEFAEIVGDVTEPEDIYPVNFNGQQLLQLAFILATHSKVLGMRFKQDKDAMLYVTAISDLQKLLVPMGESVLEQNIGVMTGDLDEQLQDLLKDGK